MLTTNSAGEAQISTVPVKSVTLFSSGVAYILREGDIPGGEATVSLNFRTTQINDILKSLVVLDGSGTVQAATLPTRDPVTRTLQSFAVDVTGNPSRATLLQQLRGAPALVETSTGERITGRIVSVEERQEVVNDRYLTIQTLSLLGEEGLQAVDLSRVRLLRLLDPRLDKEFRDALTVLASGSDDNRRTLSLTFTGNEARKVQVGYIAEAPLWKVSYRLVLEDTEKPYLQGWAMVENTSEEDWESISLRLISGRPVSFIQDLYQPLYVPRPVVPPDIIASPYPQTHAGNQEDEEGYRFGEGPAVGAMPMEDDAPRFARRSLSAAVSAAAPAPMGKAAARQAVRPQAEAKSVGELFEYQIDTPVSLPRQQAALIPIVSDDADGQKLSLYNPANDPQFPLNAFRLKNTTALHLKAGPITVFDEGVYAGDARMEEIPPGDTRLITYAVDLAITGERQEKEANTERTLLTIRRGVLNLKHYMRQSVLFTFKSRAKKDRTVLVEYPFSSGRTLLEPATYAERTPDRYRFEVVVPAGSTAHLTVTEQWVLGSSIALLDAATTSLAVHLHKGEVSEGLRNTLSEVIARRQAIDEVGLGLQRSEQQQDKIARDQDRIRKNLGSIDKDSALYRRYLGELEEQENRLAELAKERERQRTQLETLQSDLKTYLDNLNLE